MFLPIITALSFFGATAFAADSGSILPADVKAYHEAMTFAQCQDDLFLESEVFDLNGKSQLYIVPCSFAAYQGMSRAYIKDTFDEIRQVMILSYSEAVRGVVGTVDLTSPYFDPETGTLATLSKGAGSGGCGGQTVSQLIDDDGYADFKTTEVRHKAHCDGNIEDEWPVVFQQ